MKIIKKENGNVLLTDGSGNTVKRFPEGAVIELENNGRGEFVRIAYGHQNKHDIYPSTITATQIEPDAEVAFSGTAQDLLNLLSTSFFFEVVNGGNFIYPSNYYLDFLPVFSNNNGRPYSQDNFFGTIVRINAEVELEDSFLEVTATAVGSGIAGLYKYNEDTGDWDLAINIGIFDLSITGTQYLAYTPTKVEAGIYCYGWIISVGASLRSVAVNQQELIFGRPAMSNYLNRMTFAKVYDGTLPTTTTATIQASATANPLIYHKNI